MTSPEYIVAGHSHMFCMGAPFGYKGPLALTKTEDGSGYFLMEEWTPRRSPAYWDTLVSASAGRHVVLAFSGNQHHVAFTFAPDPLFDVFDERTPELLSDAILVPKRLVEAFFAPSMLQLKALLPKLQNAGCSGVHVIGTPPPKSDIHLFTEIIEKTMAKQRGIEPSEMQISPAPLLLKLWRIVQEITETVALEGGASFVPVPASSQDADGYLSKEFYSITPSDFAHANAQFGRMMLQHVLERI